MPELFTDAPRDSHNQQWLDNVHPADWSNPSPANKYNLVVIGAGSAGLVTAAGAAGLGAKVALVEKNYLGGDCLNYGCVPSKTILRAAHAVQDIHEAGAVGVNVDPTQVNVDFAAVMERVRRIRSHISHHDSAERFAGLGVDVFLGEASFAKAGEIHVGDSVLKYSKAVIATGARALVPLIPGIDETGYLTNESVFNLTEQPRRLLVVGGGPIGCELAQAFQALGTQVIQVEAGPRLLVREDEDASCIVASEFDRIGVDVRLETKFARAWMQDDRKMVELERGGNSESLEVDQILLAVGRKPNLDNLKLDAVGVDFDKRGVKVDATLKTTNSSIYACGDICLPYQFTHMADASARIVIRNALFSFLPKKAKWTDLIVPWCTYTRPEIAHVGMGELEAAEQGIEVDVYKKEFSNNDRALTDEEPRGFVKIITQKGSDRILGGIIVANRAGDMVNEITMAMKHKIGLGSVASVIHPYPTQAEAIRQCGDLYNKTRLTPGKKKLLTRIWSWMR